MGLVGAHFSSQRHSQPSELPEATENSTHVPVLLFVSRPTLIHRMEGKILPASTPLGSGFWSSRELPCHHGHLTASICLGLLPL